MRLNELVRSLASRWYIVLTGLVLTGAACAFVYNRVPATYEANGSLVLMPPSSTVGESGNPYLYLVGMSQALDILILEVNAPEVRNPVLSQFADTSYTLEQDHTTSGAIVRAEAAGPNPDATMGELQAALDTVPATLKAMQDEVSVPEASRITLKTIVVDPKPTKNSKTQTQLLIITAGSGLAGTVLLSRMLDGLLLARLTVRREPIPATDEAPEVSPKRSGRFGRRSPGVPSPTGSWRVPQGSRTDEPPARRKGAKVRSSIP